MHERRRISILRQALVGTAGLFLLAVLLERLSLELLIEKIFKIEWYFIAPTLLLYLAVNLLRVERFFILLGGGFPRRELLSIVFLQNFWNVVLPLRLGELSYVYLLRQSRRILLPQIIASLAGSRLFDVLGLTLLFFVSLLFGGASALPQGFFAAMAAVLFVVLLAASALIFGEEKLSFLFDRLASTGSHPLRSRIAVGGKNFLSSLSALRKGRIFSRTFILSLSIWGITFVTGALLLLGVGVRRPFGELLFVYAFPMALSLTPLHTFGGFGSYEGSVVAGLSFLGVGVSDAVAASILLHLFELMFVILFAVVGWVLRAAGRL